MSRREASGSTPRAPRWSLLAFLTAALSGGCHPGGYKLELPDDDLRFLSENRLLITQLQEASTRLIAFDLTTRRSVWQLETHAFVGASFSDNRAFAVFGVPSPTSRGRTETRFFLLDAVRGQVRPLETWIYYEDPIARSRQTELAPSQNGVTDDGTVIAAFADHALNVYQTNSGEQSSRLSLADVGFPTSVQFEPGAKGLFVEFELEDKKHQVVIVRRTDAGWAIAETVPGHDAKWTAQGLYYVAEGHVFRHEESGAVAIASDFDVGSPRYSPDGRFIGTQRGATYHVYDVVRRAELPPIPFVVSSISFGKNDLLAFLANGELWRVDLLSNERRKLQSFGKRYDTYRIPVADMGLGVNAYYGVLLGPGARYLVHYPGPDGSGDTMVYDAQAIR